MSDIFICKHCGREMGIKQFGRHLWKIHNQKYENYVKDNLADFASHGWQHCVICGVISKKKTCSRKCFSKHCSNLKAGIIFGPMSDETKQKLSEDRKQKYANGWAPRVGKLHSAETKQKIGIANKENYSITENCPRYGVILSQEVKDKISQTRIEKGVAVREKNGMFGKTHTPEAIKKIFAHRRMNRLEKIVADELDKAKILYNFQYFITENGVCKSYDFKIKGKPLIIEVDGDFWHGNPAKSNHYYKADFIRRNDRIKDEMAQKKGIKVVRLWESDIKKDSGIILKALG